MSVSSEKTHYQIRHVTAKFRGMADRSENMHETWRKFGAYMSREVRRQFATKGVYFGTPWKPLAPSTIKDRLRKGYRPGPMLVRSGQMRKSFVGRPMDIETFGPMGPTYGSSLDKANWQNYGTKRHGKRHIPARPILRIKYWHRDKLDEMILDHIMGRRR